MPNAKDLFGDSSPKKAAAKFDEYLGELNKSVANATFDPSVKARAESGMPVQFGSENPVGALEALAANKSLTPDAVAGLNSALAAQRSASADIVKDISLNTPFALANGGFAAFDLEAPAKLLVPKPTPLRNKLPRTKGIGNAHRIKRIKGYSNAATGGLPKIHPGMSETTQNNFAPNGSSNALYLNRGSKISYAAEDAIFNYASFGLSDSVSFDANFSAQGYQDLRQLSTTSLLFSSMMAEERMLLMGRGTSANGFSGALAAPTITATARTAANGETPISAATKVWVKAVSSAGDFGSSVVSSVASATPDGSTQVIDVKISAPVSGALGYKVFAGAAASEPADSAKFFNGSSATTTITLQGTLAVAGDVASNYAADTSAYSNGYDGILSYVLGANSGYNNNINTTFSTSNPGVEFQTAFAAMYQNVLADPDEVFLNGADRKQLSDAIKNGSTANYRLNLTQSESGDYVGGAVIGAIHNEITGKLVDLTVHPYLPQGVAPILSYTLPFENSEVSNIWAVVNVQDYMALNWPVIQQSYDQSTYWRGTFVNYAPQWSGAVSGIKAA